MPSADFMKLYIDELKDLYSAENQLTVALPKLAKAASSPALQQAFQSHLEETKGHIQRLEQIFEGLERSPKGKKCKAMAGLIEEGAELLEEKDKMEAEVLDAGLIGAAQRVEHYEIAAYGTVRTFAQQLGDAATVKLLQQTLDEEYAADEKLTALAVGSLNKEAVAQ
ncbi:MAG: ferritin-like domain-containing protein [Chloroflexi bacterium]|nr:ferritin-like domain-containing protein [Chloroflexota bacterium]